jgi:hypothetical protein
MKKSAKLDTFFSDNVNGTTLTYTAANSGTYTLAASDNVQKDYYYYY